MKNKLSTKLGFVIVLSALLFVSLFNPITVGYNTNIKITRLNENQNILNSSFNRYAVLDPYSPEINIPEKDKTEKIDDNIESSTSLQFEKQKEEPTLTELSNNAPLDSPWPMYCHDICNTGRSPYSTAENIGQEKWRFDTIHECSSSPIIDNQGIIYAGGTCLIAIYPNGTKKWTYWPDGRIVSAPAIDENGILYFGIIYDNKMYAIYSNNRTVKWTYNIGPTWASPTVGEDGIIYVPATDHWRVFAFYQNGTVKWKFRANEKVYSSPAIGGDGTIYATSWDKYLYALYPNNGTIKWKYDTGGRIRTSPCIDDNGIIYTVSATNGLLSAFYPNGTLKWKTGVGGGTSPTIGQDGTIYCGYKYLRAVNPDNGSIIWSFDPGEDRTIRDSTPCNSADGIIYFGTYINEYDGGELIAVNQDGTERWRIILATNWIMSAPAIGEDGTVYVGSWNDGYHPGSWGYLHAIGPLDRDAPTAPVIKGETSGTAGKEYQYSFESTSPLGRDVYYYIDWGDNTIKNWFGPFNSGNKVKVNHTYSDQGAYTINARSKDTKNLWGPWGEFKVTMPRSKDTSYSFIFQFLERFSLLKNYFS